MTQEQLPPHDAQPAPAMELLDGDATPAPAAGTSWLAKAARGAMYGAVLLAATALIAVSAVPELAHYASFVPEKDGSACHAATAGGSCSTLDRVNFDLAGCASKAMARFNCASIAAGTCCPHSAESTATDEALVATTATSGCAGASGCCLLNGEIAGADQPIDAGSLLAAADEPADEQPAEQGPELKPDDNQVEE